MQSLTRISRKARRVGALAGRAAWLASLVVLIGCAGGAPPLPPDTMSVDSVRRSTTADFVPADLALSCRQIALQRSQNYDAIELDLHAAQQISPNNEAAMYAGGFFPPAYLFVKDDKPINDQVQLLYGRNDTLVKLAAVKSCPS